jgi:phytoene dehydrogenase-like protein
MKIQEKQQAMSGKIGGDSVFTLYLTLNLDKNYFSSISSEHFFYTPSPSGLSKVKLRELMNDESDKPHIIAWLRRFLELNTYEISCPVLRDNALAPADKTGLIISALFEYSLAKHIREMGWHDEFRELMTDCIIDVLNENIYPGLKAAVIDSFTSTPLSIEKITGNRFVST